MALAKFTKQSYEKFAIEADFSDNMETGETITGQTITAEDNAGTDATGDILSNPQNDGAQSALVLVHSGNEALSPYKITFRVITSLSHQWELDVSMKVKEL